MEGVPEAFETAVHILRAKYSNQNQMGQHDPKWQYQHLKIPIPVIFFSAVEVSHFQIEFLVQHQGVYRVGVTDKCFKLNNLRNRLWRSRRAL